MHFLFLQQEPSWQWVYEGGQTEDSTQDRIFCIQGCNLLPGPFRSKLPFIFVASRPEANSEEAAAPDQPSMGNRTVSHFIQLGVWLVWNMLAGSMHRLPASFQALHAHLFSFEVHRLGNWDSSFKHVQGKASHQQLMLLLRGLHLLAGHMAIHCMHLGGLVLQFSRKDQELPAPEAEPRSAIDILWTLCFLHHILSQEFPSWSLQSYFLKLLSCRTQVAQEDDHWGSWKGNQDTHSYSEQEMNEWRMKQQQKRKDKRNKAKEKKWCQWEQEQMTKLDPADQWTIVETTTWIPCTWAYWDTYWNLFEKTCSPSAVCFLESCHNLGTRVLHRSWTALNLPTWKKLMERECGSHLELPGKEHMVSLEYLGEYWRVLEKYWDDDFELPYWRWSLYLFHMPENDLNAQLRCHSGAAVWDRFQGYWDGVGIDCWM